MAVLSGSLIKPIFAVPHNPLITSGFDEYARQNYPGEVSDGGFKVNGTIIRQVAPGISRVINGSLIKSFHDDYYGQIHIIPMDVDLGNLTGDVTVDIEIFNAFFVTKDLTSIDQQNFDGLIYTGIVTPKTFQPLESVITQLSAGLDGPPTVDAFADFIFNPLIENTFFNVTGNRVIVMPYYFSAPATEGIVWSTDIMESRDGTEQRVRRRNRPRQQFEVTAKISINELSRADNLLYGWRQRTWGMPNWTETRIAASATAGDLFIDVDTKFADFRVGSLAIIWQHDRKFQAVIIDSITDIQLTISDELNENYTNANVMPVHLCRMIANPSRSTNGANAFLNFSYEVLDNVEILSSLDTQPFGDGIEVYLEEPLLLPNFIRDQYNQQINVVDYGSNRPEFYAPWIYPKIVREFGLLLDGLEEVSIFKEWLYRRAGKAIPFYMPTFENNMRLLSTGLITDIFTITNDENATQGQQRDHIGFFKTDGTWVFRTVVDISVDPQDDVTVEVDSSVSIDADDIDFISYVGLKRLSSDKIDINWQPNCVAEVTLPIIETNP